ncbi:MBL fold metallo-hydrolase [Antarcticimicrobium luteum]|uniref:MBL fold metallo-hydrolase n=1 Tax=Antarcticimicrobium luteum TaxID=2547397 RepID=A0A4R5UTM7_9RHOB|nr:MBL fold metallo-hydrolase [Antarcticimicrobium luteum]TDK42385.1 MBL fold metallo-hydrolase [Antarcticimicrobium luteum]
MWVERVQYAVGQGGFHGGGVYAGSYRDCTLPPAFTYVYDCGSDQSWALDPAVDRFAARFGDIDALFISHLDRDHVNGIDSLLSKADVDTVYLPYLNDVCQVLDLLEADGESGLSGSLIEAALDPASWFGSRGVRRVIRVGPGGPEGSDGPFLPEPSREPEPDRSEIVAKIGPQDATVLTQGREGSRAELCRLTPGSSVVFSGDAGLLDWVLIPHVTPAPKENVAAFLKALRSALDLETGRRLNTSRLLEGLSKARTRKKMKDSYEAIIAGGARRMHNRISMSLYSGPTGRGSRTHWVSELDASRWLGHCPYQEAIPPAPVGWLGTGDATLKVEDVWNAFRAAYDPVLGEVVTLDLPHHGSKHNFRSDLTALPGLRHAIANASKPSRHKHPSPYVIHELESAGIHAWLVSQEPSTELEETVWQVR